MLAAALGGGARPSRPPGPRPAHLSWFVLVVVCAHAAVLSTPKTTLATEPVRGMRVRLLPGGDAPTPRPASPTRTATAQARVGAVKAQHEDALPTLSSSGREATASAPRPSDLRADSLYLARSDLTVGPKAQGPVVIDYPFFDGEADHYLGEFDLFIDDRGGVVRVVSVTESFPGLLVQAVRSAFLAARFTPGEVQGRPVRSRVRIEVTFDSGLQQPGS
jgi:protein TonB